MSGGRYSVRNLEAIETWMLATPSRAAREAMHTWVEAAMWDPHAVAHGAVARKDGRGYPLHYAVVPGTSCLVTFIVRDVPVRFIRIVSVVEAPDA